MKGFAACMVKPPCFYSWVHYIHTAVLVMCCIYAWCLVKPLAFMLSLRMALWSALYGLACAQGLKGDGHRNLVIFSTMVKNAEVRERQHMILKHTSTEKLKRQSEYLWNSHCWFAKNLSLQVDLEILQRRIPKGDDSDVEHDMEGTTGSTPSKRTNAR